MNVLSGTGAGGGAPDTFFFVNGPPRLMLASMLASEQYKNATRHLLLLDQYGYNYDDLLPFVRDLFDTVDSVTVKAKRYSHFEQFVGTYLRRYGSLQATLRGGGTLVLFGIRSPLQKFLVRYFKHHGGTVNLYAESLAIEGLFLPKDDRNPLVRFLRALFSRAFDIQHDYDSFHVYVRERYRGTAHYEKLEEMPDLYQGAQFKKLADRIWKEMPELGERSLDADVWFFGQPLSNFDGLMSKEEEVAIMRSILGNLDVLALPHPNEILGDDDKYSHLPNVRVLRSRVPNDLLLGVVRPRRTITYASTIGLTYAIHNPESHNSFFPVYRSQLRELREYQKYLRNISVSDEFVIRDRQY